MMGWITNSMFGRVLVVVVAAGLVALGFATFASVRTVTNDKEAQLTEAALQRTSNLRSALDQNIDLTVADLRAVALSVTSEQTFDASYLISEMVTAIRCVRNDEQLLDMATSPQALSVLQQVSLPPPGQVALAEERQLVVAQANGEISSYAVLDLSPILHVPEGWSVELVDHMNQAIGPDWSRQPGIADQIRAGGVVARRNTGTTDDDYVNVLTSSRHGPLILVQAPLLPARAAAFRTTQNILVWSSLAVIPLVLMAWLFGRAVTAPIRSLALAVREAEESVVNLPRLPRDEVGDLGAAIKDMSQRLYNEALVLQIAVEFSRRVSAALETDEILVELEKALREGLNKGDWIVIPSHKVESHASHQDTSNTILIRPPIVATFIPPNESESARFVLSLTHKDTTYTYGVVEGRDVTESDELLIRQAQLLCGVAVAALWNLEVHRTAVANEKLAVLGRVLAEVTHEMRNPLAFVLANLLALESELDGKQLEAVVEARQGTKRLERILGDLSSLSTGGLKLTTEEVDLCEIVRNAIKLARPRRPDCTIKMEGSTPIPVVGDRGRLEQTVLNLVINAADAASSHETPQVRVSVGSTENQAWVEVIDNGDGVPSAIVNRLFTAFFTTKKDEGSGLGLFLCKSFAAAHGGDVKLVKTSPEGSIFRLSLPKWTGVHEPAKTSSTPGPKKALSQPAKSIEKRPRVLVVDDEVLIIRALQRWLGRWAEVIGTTDPEEGLFLATSQTFSLILCDFDMGGTTGAEFYNSLIKRVPRAANKFVIMTGSSVQVELPDVMILEKPLQPREITRLLDAY